MILAIVNGWGLSCLFPHWPRGWIFFPGTLRADIADQVLTANQAQLERTGRPFYQREHKRVHPLEARTSQGADADAARIRSLAAYKDFLTLWKDADPDIPILKEAKAEYARLQ